jgi:hypothetical protein
MKYEHHLAIHPDGIALVRGTQVIAVYQTVTEAGQALLDAEAGLIGAAAVQRVLEHFERMGTT